jgi:signal transduction histidine kinase
MSQEPANLPRLRRSLSARLLLLTIAFVMLAEVMIYTPSIARFRLDYLTERLVDAHIATLALEATPTHMVSPELETQLLTVVGAYSVVRIVQGQTRMLIMNREMPPTIDASYDLRRSNWVSLVADAFVTLAQPKNRILRVVGPSPFSAGMAEELVLDETPLRRAMYDYSTRILSVSIMISLVTAGLVYLALQMMLVRPLRQVTASMHEFSAAPDDVGTQIEPTGRRDEIGMVQRELARLQTELRASLREKTRLAALGSAMIRINHDLRNILATAQLVSDRLGHLEDATVRRLTPTLIAAIDRAIALCVNTITFAREDMPAPRPERFRLRPLAEEVGAALAPMAPEGSRWQVEMPDNLMLHADRDQIFRVLVNLGRNAYEAAATSVQVIGQRTERGLEIEVSDNGQGFAPAARQRLFQAFAGSGKAGGSGLGLAIVRDVLRAHGGDIELASSRPGETRFRLLLPERRVAAA